MTELPKKAYCVIDKKTGKRVSQFYARHGDAVNKWKSYGYCKEQYKPVSFDLTYPTSVLENLDE